MNLILPLLSVFASLFIFLLFKFANAYGDFILMSKRHIKREGIEHKVVWIIGGSRGIGEVLSKQLASLGAKLIISTRNEAELKQVKRHLHGKNAPNERPVKISALDVTEESLKATFNVNVLGTISLTRLLVPFMLRRGRGHYVVMSSAAGKTPAPGQAVYSASRYALNGTFIPCVLSFCGRESEMALMRHVSLERCVELTIMAATRGLKEVWISYQPVLAVMYLVPYMPTIGYWIMDKVGGNRVEAAAQKGNRYSWSLLFGKKKAA
ncbi:Dehydrogenase/reductase SDR family member 7 like [Quillaja saponaria]|uniref:Dehydrogenase/reductase SDR family member 7 like n=1 Tax=Quillaja saponaria TaxID=32244 RepID=A0AAD7Q2K5_QUISA|nr:Dehydrogenase/reductase SDR family member 7 like [Quillaja saponaria]